MDHALDYVIKTCRRAEVLWHLQSMVKLLTGKPLIYKYAEELVIKYAYHVCIVSCHVTSRHGMLCHVMYISYHVIDFLFVINLNINVIFVSYHHKN